MYDEVLRLDLLIEAESIGFVDEPAILVTASSVEEVIYIGNEAVIRVQNWLYGISLDLVAHKIEVVQFSKWKRVDQLNILENGYVIESKQPIQYLGFIVDTRIKFKNHQCVQQSPDRWLTRALA